MSVEVTAQCDCQNNGTCVDSGKGKRECRCAEGFSGKQCERDLCKELGCQNNGKCIIRNGRAVCNCPRGLQGDKCHQIQEVDQQVSPNFSINLTHFRSFAIQNVKMEAYVLFLQQAIRRANVLMDFLALIVI
jgi:hypothetical protein